VFVGPAEPYNLENPGSHLARNHCGRANFLKKGKQVQNFADVK
jgi:hypothetical protein